MIALELVVATPLDVVPVVPVVPVEVVPVVPVLVVEVVPPELIMAPCEVAEERAFE